MKTRKDLEKRRERNTNWPIFCVENLTRLLFKSFYQTVRLFIKLDQILQSLVKISLKIWFHICRQFFDDLLCQPKWHNVVKVDARRKDRKST